MTRSAKKRHGARRKRQDHGRNDSDGKHDTPHPGQEGSAAPPVGNSSKDDRNDEQSQVESSEQNTSSDSAIDRDITKDRRYHPFVRATIKAVKEISAWKKGHASWREARKAGKMPYLSKS